ncbi:MAG: TPM domain-containing protein, partial [Patescibacteria group bacterium]
MKKFLFLVSAFIFFVGAHTSLAFDIPNKPQSFVNDFANILSVEDKSSLENKISNFEKQTGNEITVVIIPSLDGDTVENVAQNIFTKWGIGKKEKNNGVLILIAMTERKTRIH